MTEEYSEAYPEVESGLGSGARGAFPVWRVPREIHERQLEKYQNGERLNFKDYRTPGEHLFTDKMGRPSAEKIRRDCGAGYFIVECLFNGSRTPDDWFFVAIPPRGAAVLPAEGRPRYYGRQEYGPPRPYHQRPRNMPRSRGGGRDDGLLRELFEHHKEQSRAELAREQERGRELREMEQRHAEDRRRLEQKLEEERFKRLEEKIEESRTRKDEEPADVTSALLQFAVKEFKSGNEETAEALLNRATGSDQGGGFWGFAQGVTREVIEIVRENPQGALEFAASVMPGIRGNAPAPDGAATQQPPQQPAAPVSREQLSDIQLVTGLSRALAAGIVGDNDPTPYAQEVRDILEERPHLREQFEAMLTQSDEDLLATLSTAARVSFDSLGRKPVRWARDFRKALLCFGIGAAVSPVEPVNNGHKAQAADVAK